MCIPIALDVPVLTRDEVELGTAREILCTSPHEDSGSLVAEPTPIRGTAGSGDLWLRVDRAGYSDLFVPFGEIVETRSEGVSLAVTAAEAAARGWDRVPPDLPLSRTYAA